MRSRSIKNGISTYRHLLRIISGIILALLLLLPGAATPAHADEAYTLVVGKVGEGTITITPNLGWYPAGTTVNLTITPAEGWVFLRWNGFRVWPGGISDSYEKDISFVMDAHKSITAYLYKYDDEIIDIPDPGLESAVLAKLGRPAGYDIRRTELATLTHLNAQERGVTNLDGLQYCMNLEILNLYGNSITDISPLEYCTDLTSLHIWGNLIEDITPLVNNTGMNAGDWITIYHNRLDLNQGPDMGNIQTLQARGVSIDYLPQDTGPAPASYVLTTSHTGQGTITRNPDLTSYDSGTSIQLTATPNNGWQFAGWGGVLTGIQNPATIVITGDITVTATFTEITTPFYSMTISTNGNGSVILDPPGTTYASGTPVQLTAVPDSGWTFSGWTGDVTGAANPASVTITQNMVITASFTQTTTQPPISAGGIAVSTGGGATETKRFTPVYGSCTPDGTLWEDLTALSVDVQLELIISEGTMVLNANGYPVHTITVTTISKPGNCPVDGCFLGHAYDLEPRGISFDHPARLVLHYDDDEIPEGVLEERLHIATFNTDTETWEYLDCEVDADNKTLTAELYHFSEYTVMASTRPAEFESSSLTVTPASVSHDATITAGLTVTNTGDLPGEYRMVYKIDGLIVEERDIRLNGGESKNVEARLRPGATGSHTIDINGISSSFEVLPLPASFGLSELIISPDPVTAGESVQVTVSVTNTGETGGDYHIDCGLNGTTTESRDMYIAAESSEEASFTLTPLEAGTYIIDINGDMQGELTVEKAAAIPEGEIDIVELANEQAATTIVLADNEDTAPSGPSQTVRWWLAGGIVIGILFIGTIITLARRNRQSK